MISGSGPFARAGVLAIALSALAGAQSSNGYVFFAPGGLTCCGQTEMTLHIGGGGEYVFAKRLGVGVEIGALGPRRAFGDAVGVVSPNGYFHIPGTKDARFDPFVTGGYTLMFRSGHANLANFGGGATFWLSSRLGLRIEARDHMTTERDIAHFWGIRFGLAFR